MNRENGAGGVADRPIAADSPANSYTAFLGPHAKTRRPNGVSPKHPTRVAETSGYLSKSWFRHSACPVSLDVKECSLAGSVPSSSRQHGHDSRGRPDSPRPQACRPHSHRITAAGGSSLRSRAPAASSRRCMGDDRAWDDVTHHHESCQWVT